VPGIYRPRHPERTVLYRLLFHHFERFVVEYEARFEKEYGYFRRIVREVVERYLDSSNPRSGFARIRCPDCHAEHLLAFSCKARGFCPSCHAKHLEEWGEWMREKLLLDVPHRQVVFTIPKTLRMDYLEFIARGTSHISDKGQVMVRYYGLYANAQIHQSLDVDVRSREASARPSL